MGWTLRKLSIFLDALLSSLALCWGLECWLCIAENCQTSPRSNVMAARQTCDPGQACQKVYYKALNPQENRFYESITRSCSYGPCVPRDDFYNCTIEMMHNPGCVRHECCSDQDLCNTAHTRKAHVVHVIITGGATLCFIAFRRIIC